MIRLDKKLQPRSITQLSSCSLQLEQLQHIHILRASIKQRKNYCEEARITPYNYIPAKKNFLQNLLIQFLFLIL